MHKLKFDNIFSGFSHVPEGRIHKDVDEQLSAQGLAPEVTFEAVTTTPVSPRGFTLLELTIAASIFVIAVCGIASLFVSLTALTQSAGNITRMANLAREELENNILTTDFATLNSYRLLPPAVPSNTSLACYVRNHPTINNLKQATVVVCYRQAPNRVIGEDKNLNGVLNRGEDDNGDGRLTSLCEFDTFIVRKE